MRAALLAAKDACDLPVICQLSFSEDGRTVTGTDPQSAAIFYQQWELMLSVQTAL